MKKLCDELNTFPQVMQGQYLKKMA